MRYFVTGLILFFMSNKIIAQNFKRISVPEVKEIKRIDSLIDEAVNLSKVDSSCLHIEVLNPNSNDYGFLSIWQTNKFICYRFGRKGEP